ncbi:MAG: nicotinate-nucleotide pyrophosphorylase (carboxylating) [Candidatus Azotimanducaceae bacterium]|jgi:nicotinate-nucleotide pyrophosphorylase (carboxylating)
MTEYFKDLTTNVAAALAEDVGDGDVTAELIKATKQVTAHVITREAGVLCGRPWVDEVFRQVDSSLKVVWHSADGDQTTPDQLLFTVTGNARAILTGERPALNFLQTLSGTATATARMANLIKHTATKLLDTRKTLPGLRLGQKYAVSCGGGMNHRIGLYDAFLIKENHIEASGSIASAIGRARTLHPGLRVEIEVETLEQFHEAALSQPDWIMLDNFSLADMRTAVQSNQPVKLEASGGIESDQDLIAIAETGVDYISVGALTKHVRAMDLSMRVH